MRVTSNFDEFLKRNSFPFPNIQNFYALPMQSASVTSKLNDVSYQLQFQLKLDLVITKISSVNQTYQNTT